MAQPDFNLQKPTEPTQAMREIEKAIDAFRDAAREHGLLLEWGRHGRDVVSAYQEDQARARLVRLIEEAMK